MTVKLSPFGPKPSFSDSNGAPLVGGKLQFYAAGSTTPQNTYTSSTGSVANANPVILNSRGEPTNEIWFTEGLTYKVVLLTSADVVLWTVDNISAVNDFTSFDEWKNPALTPTFVSATSFTLSGDQTTEFHNGRRLKSTNTAGTVYSTITASSFAAGTTTITVANDSGSLDSGLSAVSYGILRASHPSIPIFQGRGFGFTLDGGYLDWSVSANALTIAIKTWTGNNPSDTEPVYVAFRSSTVATGLPLVRRISAATSLTISSGSTLGTANSVAFRVWVVGFDDAGTFRLGAINCLSTTAGAGAGRDVTAIYPLKGWGIASSTAEGGAGAADSAQTFYTGSAVASKAYATLGYATWESGLATAGTWSAGPTRAQLWGALDPLPGDIIQVQRTDIGAVATGTTTVPYDDTIPQNTEGDQYMSQAITPSSAANVVSVSALAMLSTTVAIGNVHTMALFQDATANALKASHFSSLGNAIPFQMQIGHRQLASTTSAATFKIRAGNQTANTTTFNGNASGREYGGVINSYLEVTEVMA